MSKKRRRPSTTAKLDGASIAAWLVFLTGVAAFVGAIYQNAVRPAPPPVNVGRAAPQPVAKASPPAVPDAITSTPSQPPATPIQREASRRDAEPTRRPRATAAATPVDLLAARPRAGRRPARVAIIIDDIGHDLRAIERLSRLPYRLTFAVIPHLKHSRAAADILNRRGYEIMLHLPMEPIDYPRSDPGRGAILSGMRHDEIRDTVLADLAAVPHIRGVNNHMGSRITSDSASMRTILETLRESSFFFIDSRTANSSVAYEMARDMQIPSAQRSVFLDDDQSRDAVRREFRNMVRIARASGSAIAIGHPHPVTLDVLTAELPTLARQGVEFVFASELVI